METERQKHKHNPPKFTKWPEAVINAYRVLLDNDRFIEAGKKLAYEGRATLPEVKLFYDPVHSYRAVAIPLQVAALILLPYLLWKGNLFALVLYCLSVFAFHFTGMRWSLRVLDLVEDGKINVIRSFSVLYLQGFIFSLSIDLVFIAFLIDSTHEFALLQLLSWGFGIMVLTAAYYFHVGFAILMLAFNLTLLSVTAFLLGQKNAVLSMILMPQNVLFAVLVIGICAFTLRTIMKTHYIIGIDSQVRLNRANEKVIQSLDDVSRLNTQMARIANSSEHGIALVNADNSVGLMNERFRSIFGIAKESQIIDADAVIPYELLNNDDTQFSLYYNDRIYLASNVEIDGDQRRDGKMLFLTDITKRTREERERIQFERLGILGTLSSGIAHDFNNLLAIIQNQIEGIGLRNPNLNERESIEDIEHAIASGSALARQLLSYTHEMPLSRERIHLGDLVERTIKLAKPALGENLSVTVQAQNDAAIIIDSYIFEVNLMNLIINARDAMDGSGPIMIAIDRAGEMMELRVSDEGVGIDAQALAHVFEPFYTSKDRSGNAGLGLALAKSFVEKSGGSIAIESEDNIGTTVIMRLPIANDLPDMVVSPQIGNGNGNKMTVKTQASIAVIDDNEALVRSQVKLLSHWYSDVSGFRSIAELRANGPLSAFDLVLCDLLLDNESGVDVLTLFRGSELETPILFFSGNVPPKIRDQINVIEPSVFMEKPVATKRLIAEIDARLQRVNIAG